MKCTSCNSELKPGAKFCTRCGQKQSEREISGQNNSFAAKSGEATDVPEGISMIKHKITWNIKAGEIARSIKETELMNYESAQGIIINDGTTAYIKSNGKLIAELHGGNYDFIPSEQLDKLLESRTGGVAGFFSGARRSIINFVLGSKVRDNISDSQSEVEKLRSLDQVIEHMKKGDLFSITLKQDREFQLIFGDQHQDIDDYSNFKPMQVQTKHLDVNVGLRAFFQIRDFNEFSAYYLTESNVVRTNTLANDITPFVEAAMKSAMSDVELKENRIPADVRDQIELRLKTSDFHGIELRSIIEVTAQSEDLERLQAMSRELYLSELELDQLLRTNEFRNRLTSTTDDQTIYDMTRDVDIHRRMHEVNKDGLLNQAEFDKFYTLLKREKDIFEAQNQNELDASLAEIEKTGLLRDEEMEIMKHQIEQGTYQRGFAMRLMELKDGAEYEKTRTGEVQAIEMQTLMHELELDRKKQEFRDERFHKEREKERTRTMDERDDVEFMHTMAQKELQAQLDAIAQLNSMDEESEDKATERRIREKQQELDYRLQSEKESHTTERERIRSHENMSHDQIMAQQAHNLSEAAQVEYARNAKVGELKDQHIELMKEQAEIQRQMHAASNADMKDVIALMMGKMNEVNSAMAANEKAQKEEYRTQLQREQNRHDKHQDTALNYTTRGESPVIIAQSQPVQQQPAQVAPMQQNDMGVKTAHTSCPKCGMQNKTEDRFCVECGTDIG